jgi:hypothetical protein
MKLNRPLRCHSAFSKRLLGHAGDHAGFEWLFIKDINVRKV